MPKRRRLRGSASLTKRNSIEPAARVDLELLEARQLLSAVTQWSSRGPGGGGAFFSPSFSPYDSSELYTVSDMSGLYHSTNLGQSWNVANFKNIQGGIGSQVQFTSDPNILYTLDYSDTADGSGSVAPSQSTDGGKTWHQVSGWNGADDQAFSLFADPQNTTSLLVTDYGKLFFSNNGGQSFAAVFTDPSSGQGCYVGGVFWDGNNVYVGTDSGLIVSTNGGASFSSANISGLPSGASILSFAGAKENGVTRLVCVTADSGDVFNGLETGSISQSNLAAVWTLTPGQSTWTKATSIPAGDSPLLVSMANNDINDIYIGGTNFDTSDPIVAKSTDGGRTFTDVLNLTNNGNVATGWQGAGGDRGWGFDQLTEGFEVSPSNPNEIAFTGYGFLHLSTDGGQTWRQAYVNPATQNPAGANTPQGKSYQGVGLEDTSTLYLSWADQQTILAGYTDIDGVRSTDGGQSWSFPTGVTLAGNTIYCITKQGSTFYAATSNTHDIYQSTHVTNASTDSGTGNILYSTDNGASWQIMHSFGHPVVWVATDPTDPNRLYASVVGSTAGGIYTTDNLSAGTGATWTKLTAPPRTQGHPFNIDVLNDGTVVATYSATRSGSFASSSGVFVSTDHGQTWSDRTGSGMQWWTKDITIDPTDPTQNTWYASVRLAYGTSGASDTGGLYRTTDRGQTWTQIFQSIGAESASINPSTGEMYVSTEENGLYYSADPSAATPTFTQTDYPFRQPERIFFNPFNPNEVWVTSFGYGLAVGEAGGVVSGPVASNTNLITSATSAEPGATVIFTATVSSASDNGQAPTGTVTFSDGGVSLGSVALQSDGTATLSTSSLANGTHTITASYGGDANFDASGSASVTETIGVTPPPAASSIVPAFGQLVLPASAVAGAKFKARIPAVLTNSGSALKGIYTVKLFVNSANTLDGNQTPLTQMSLKNLTLKAGKNKSLNFKLSSLPATLPAGTYYLLAEVIDPNGAANVVASTKTVSVAAPFISLSAVAGAVNPSSIRVGKSGSIAVTLTNNGNETALGTADLTLEASADGISPLPGDTLDTLMKNLKVPPSKSVRLNLHFKTALLSSGSYFPFLSVALGGNTSTAVGPSFTVV